MASLFSSRSSLHPQGTRTYWTLWWMWQSHYSYAAPSQSADLTPAEHPRGINVNMGRVCPEEALTAHSGLTTYLNNVFTVYLSPVCVRSPRVKGNKQQCKVHTSNISRFLNIIAFISQSWGWNTESLASHTLHTSTNPPGTQRNPSPSYSVKKNHDL